MANFIIHADSVSPGALACLLVVSSWTRLVARDIFFFICRPSPYLLQASNSATLAYDESDEPLHKILIFVVLTGLKVNCLHTKLFPLTLPSLTSTQLEPSQYCTSNAVTPDVVNVMSIGLFGSIGVV